MTATPKALAATHAAAFPDTRAWDATEFADLLQSKGVILYGDAKSFVLARIIADEAEVLTLATAPAFQRQGRARSLLQSFLANAIAAGAATAFLEVADDNAAAKSLYLNAGFAEVGRRNDYYTTLSGNKVAALVLRKALK